MILTDHFPLRRIWPHAYKRLLLLSGGACAGAGLHTVAGGEWRSIEALALAQSGSALAIFLAFRANAARGHWWEARQLWRSLVNTSRGIACRALTAPDVAPSDPCKAALRDDRVAHQLGFVHALFQRARTLEMIVSMRCRSVWPGLAAGMALVMLIAAILIGFTVTAIDSVASGLGMPFENTVNGFPMTALPRGIELTLRQTQGHHVSLRNVQAIDGFTY